MEYAATIEPKSKPTAVKKLGAVGSRRLTAMSSCPC